MLHFTRVDLKCSVVPNAALAFRVEKPGKGRKG